MSLMAGCGSSDDSSSEGSEGSAPATSSTPTEDSSPTADAGDDPLAEADEQVAAWSNLDIELPQPTEAFDAGSARAMVIEAGAGGGSLRIGNATEEAFKTMGWEATVFDGKFVPATQSEGIQLATEQGYDAIVLVAVDTNALKSAVQGALDKGIKLVCIQCGSTPGFDDIVNVTTTGLQDGDAMSWYIIQQTQAKANVLMVEDKAFGIVLNRVKSLQESLAERCPDCTFETVQMATADIATPGPPVLTAALQTKPDVNWVAAPYDASVATMEKTVSQLSPDSGLNGWDGDPDAVALVGKGGVVKAVTSAPYEYLSWAGADQAARMVAGLETWASDDMPVRLCTADNWEAFESGNWSPPGFDYKALFADLWSGS